MENKGDDIGSREDREMENLNTKKILDKAIIEMLREDN